ncbi:MAG: phosphorylase [Sphingomonadales bacterium]|nr:phosphorylase [Sphingomonadales bacterium]
MPVKPILVVTGTRREAQTIAGPGVVTLAGGGSRARLLAELDRLVPQSCGVLSYGMAGALDPGLRLGDWVVGTAITGDWQGACDGAFGIALAQRLRTGRRLPAQGAIHACDRLIASAAEKAELHAATGAIATDMESHIAAAAAARHGLRFTVLRCISDEAAADLPPAIAVAMKPGGGLAPGRILWSLLTRPGQLPALLRTTRRFKAAYGTLALGGGRVLRS